ncbi:MAG: alpha-amylase family glycosyl hydrolase [Bacteroidota bacterium]
MQYKIFLSLFLLAALFNSCNSLKNSASKTAKKDVPFFWENAQIYFLLTDRFYNGDSSNDVNFGRTKKTSKLRDFMGGDLRGITQKIEEGYFNDLGVDAIWFTPIVEQIHGLVDEGTGGTYGFHGYWTKDWTALDPNFGTEDDLRNLVKAAHRKGIRIMLDVVINHTGPVTEGDPVWPKSWVREEPNCTYKDFETTVTCTLVDNLPDIKTESRKAVELPDYLVQKWKAEGRYEQEVTELDAFFERTGLTRTPTNYIIKWLTDFIRDYGIDAYRVDTVKHTEEEVWEDLRKEAEAAFEEWKTQNPKAIAILDDQEFYMMGEVYGYGISGGRNYDYGDREVDFFDAFNSLINFEFKYDADQMDYEKLFTKYEKKLAKELEGKTTVNYLSSHDDGDPYDAARKRPMETATRLLLSPGSAQTYYGDETARTLIIPGTNGDATLRSFMNWEELKNNANREGYRTQDVLAHWQKLGTFRQQHPAIGMGDHERISKSPYTFQRTFKKDKFEDQVVVALDLKGQVGEIEVGKVFKEGTFLRDHYSGKQVRVKDGKVEVPDGADLILLAKDE